MGLFVATDDCHHLLLAVALYGERYDAEVRWG